MATTFVFLLLLAGKSVCMNLIHSPETMSWDEALQYCQDKNGGLIVLDSEEKWNNLTSHDVYQQFNINTGSYWISLRFNDSIPCNATNKLLTRRWLYAGWGKWKDINQEPNGCPGQKCVKLITGYMRTTRCSENHTALCETEFSSSTNNQTSNSTVTSLPQRSTIQTRQITPTRVESMSIFYSSTQIEDSSLWHTNNQIDKESRLAETTPSLTSPVSVVQTTTYTVDEESRQNVHHSSIASVFDTTSPTDSQEHQFSTPHFQSQYVSSVNAMTTTYLADVTTQKITSTTKLSSKTLMNPRNENRTCGKCCTRTNKTLSESDMDMKLTLLKVQLAVNKTNLSSTKRKHISVYDARLSTAVMGGVACIVLVTIAGIVIIPDCIALFTFLYK